MADDTPTTITRDPTPIVRDPTPVIKRDPPANTSWWGAVGTSLKKGILDPLYGGAQMGARMGPEIGGAAYADPADQEALKKDVDKTVAAREQAYRNDPNIKAYPKTAVAGDIAGQIVSTAPLAAISPGAGAATWPLRAGAAAFPGAVIATTEPVTGKQSVDAAGNVKVEPAGDAYLGKKAGQVAGGAAGAVIGQPVGEVIGKGVGLGWRGLKWLAQSEEQKAASKAANEAAKLAKERGETPEQQAAAVKEVQERFSSAQRVGRLKTGDVIKKIMDARKAGQPLALADVDKPGGRIRQLLGSVYRGPGEAGGYLEDWQEGRVFGEEGDTDRTFQGNRLAQNIQDHISSGDAAETAITLGNARSANARPLWDKAMEGGSTAPLEHQFTQQFTRATEAEAAAMQQLKEAQTRLVTARAKQQTSAAAQREAATTSAQLRARETAELGKQAVTGASLPEHPLSGYNEAERAASNDVAAAEQTLNRARAVKEGIRPRLRRAQEDGTANAKGAVWSPELQILLDNPRLKAGLRKGWEIERDNANAEFRPIDAREYAIVGMDENGDPIVGSVPNMRLIQMAKEGLDGLLENDAFRDPYTRALTKEGRAIDNLRRSLLKEGDRLNPDWKDAREQWAGDTAMLRALRDGKEFLKHSKEWPLTEFKTYWNDLSDGEREIAKTGAANTLINDMDAARLSGDQSRAMINSTEVRQKLRVMFGDTPAGKKEAQQYIDFIKNERTMWETGIDAFRGSQTAVRLARDEQEKAAAIEALKHAGRGLWHLKTGHPIEAGKSILGAATHLGWGHESGVNYQVAKILTDPAIELREGAAGQLLLGPEIQTPSATWGDAAKTAARGLGGDIGSIISSGPMFYSAPRSFAPPSQ